MPQDEDEALIPYLIALEERERALRRSLESREAGLVGKDLPNFS